MEFDIGYVVSGLVGVGSAWGTAKVTINGTKDRVETLEQANLGVIDRLARIETKLDLLLKDYN